MIVDDRNCLPIRPRPVRRLEVATTAEAEILVLRHQLNVLRQRAPRRLHLTWADRALFVWLYRGFPRILDAITIVRPETIVRWHRNGFAAYWRWKSRLSVADRRSTKSCATYPKNELREPALGCAPYPRRTAEARHRRRPVDGLEIHGATARSTVANLEDFPSRTTLMGSRRLISLWSPRAFEQLFAFVVLATDDDN